MISKPIFLVSSYPSNKKRIRILKETLRSLQNDKIDIMLYTNIPIDDDEIISLVKYYIYDKEDIKSIIDYGKITYGSGWYMEHPSFSLSTMFDNAYHFSIFKNIHNSCYFLKNLGYDFFYYIEGDNVFEKEGLEYLISLIDILNNNGKKFFNFSTEKNIFTTILFGMYIDYFLDNVNISIDVNDWMNDDFLITHSLELIFTDRFYKIDDIYITDTNILKYYVKFNLLNANTFNDLLYYDDKDVNRLYFYLINITSLEYSINLKIGEHINIDFMILPGFYYINSFNFTDVYNKNLFCQILQNNEEIYLTNITLDQKFIDKIKIKNKITFYDR